MLDMYPIGKNEFVPGTYKKILLPLKQSDHHEQRPRSVEQLTMVICFPSSLAAKEVFTLLTGHTQTLKREKIRNDALREEIGLTSCYQTHVEDDCISG
jgi:hypothetical protein